VENCNSLIFNCFMITFSVTVSDIMTIMYVKISMSIGTQSFVLACRLLLCEDLFLMDTV